jgi:hypothetical protein
MAELTEGQRRNEESRRQRDKCLREVENLKERGRPVDVEALAVKYSRTTQCVYGWIRWGKAQAAGKTKAGVA